MVDAALGRGTGNRRNGARGRSQGYGTSSFFSSSAESSTDDGEVTVVAGKRQVTPSLVDVAFTADRLSKMTVTDDRFKPMSSDLARARTSSIATADAAAEAKYVVSVRRAYVTISRKDVPRISVLPFLASLNKADGAQQLTRSVKLAMSHILIRCDNLCAEGLRSTTWVPGWDLPLKKAFMRAITPNKPTTANTTTLIDDFFFAGVATAQGGSGRA